MLISGKFCRLFSALRFSTMAIESPRRDKPISLLSKISSERMNESHAASRISILENFKAVNTPSFVCSTDTTPRRFHSSSVTSAILAVGTRIMNLAPEVAVGAEPRLSPPPNLDTPPCSVGEGCVGTQIGVQNFCSKNDKISSNIRIESIGSMRERLPYAINDFPTSDVFLLDRLS